MKPISVTGVRLLMFEVASGVKSCEKCLFKEDSCGYIGCTVGNVLKRLADEGFLSVDESAEGGDWDSALSHAESAEDLIHELRKHLEQKVKEVDE